jgi:hypothetical protein
MKSFLQWGAAALVAASGIVVGCSDGLIDAGGQPSSMMEEPDPLAVPTDVAAGSLDDIHRTIILRSCAGQAGLCHNGQFEPNLATPAQTYENLVLRPSIERGKQARVVPGDPDLSLLMDKLRNKDVISQMPLGAEPLPDEEIAAIEAWIEDGALRRPGADPAPTLNNPPSEPELAIFDATGMRLDGAGQVVVPAGTALTFRQSVEDFETADADMPFAFFSLQTAEGMYVILDPTQGANGYLGYGTYEASGAPMGKGDLLNWRYDFVITPEITLLDEYDMLIPTPSAGLSLTLVVYYADGDLEQTGMLTFAFEADILRVQP